MAEGDELRLPWIDWVELWKHDDDDRAIEPGIAYPGRWTAIAAPAKAGKSTLLTGIAINLARAGVPVAYCDPEMGRRDMQQRLEAWCQLEPHDVEHLHYLDVVPKLDLQVGATELLADITTIGPAVVVIDGLNGAVDGAENDAETWRDLYDLTIAPLKRAGIAVVTADNLGKDTGRGPRGSSVKLDKADAILELAKRDDGRILLTGTRLRTADYPVEQTWEIVGAHEDEPPMTVRRVEDSEPDGTRDLVAILDNLGLPVDISNRKARAALKAVGQTAANEALAAALRARKAESVPPPDITPAHGLSGTVWNASGATVPPPRNAFGETPGSGVFRSRHTLVSGGGTRDDGTVPDSDGSTGTRNTHPGELSPGLEAQF